MRHPTTHIKLLKFIANEMKNQNKEENISIRIQNLEKAINSHTKRSQASPKLLEALTVYLHDHTSLPTSVGNMLLKSWTMHRGLCDTVIILNGMTKHSIKQYLKLFN